MQDFQFERLPLFERLKKTTLKRLREYAEFRVCEAGETLVRQGELSEEFYVLLKGIVTVFRNEPDGGVSHLGSLGAGDWFGEMSALSHQARAATVKADMACVFLEIPPTLFNVLYSDKGGSFCQLIDVQYRKRALAGHLRAMPIFREIPLRALEKLARQAELVEFPPDHVILEGGAEADAVYLVRSGVVKRIRQEGGAEHIEAYLCDNSSFGEHALAEHTRVASAFVTMARVDAVRISRDLLDGVFSEDAAARRVLDEAVALVLAEEVPEGGEGQDRLTAEAAKGNEALVIDLNRCTRCNACVESCVAVHEDRVPRLSKRGIRSGQHLLTSACYNCKVPECMLACKFGAIRRDIHGNIHFIFDNCTGCTACETKCPYGVIRMAEILAPEAALRSQTGFLSRLPLVGRMFGQREESAPQESSRKAIKCDLCAGLPFEACVYNCPCRAIERIDASAVLSGERI